METTRTQPIAAALGGAAPTRRAPADPAPAGLGAPAGLEAVSPELDAMLLEIAELRPLSAVAARVLRLTEDDRFSAHDLASVIATDQALTAKLLRISNSAYYGFPRRITTVRDAVVLLGFRAVRSATLVSCVMDTVQLSNNLDYARFWHFSVCTGMLAEILARVEGVHQDHAFTAGVLHNVGLLALDQHQPAGLRESIRHAHEERVPLHEAERRVLGFSDAELGGALATHWNFPPDLAEAIRRHAMPLDRLPHPQSLTAFVVRARIFARSHGLSNGIERLDAGPAPEEWTVPPLSVSLNRRGGMEGVLEQVDAFLEAALA